MSLNGTARRACSVCGTTWGPHASSAIQGDVFCLEHQIFRAENFLPWDADVIRKAERKLNHSNGSPTSMDQAAAEGGGRDSLSQPTTTPPKPPLAPPHVDRYAGRRVDVAELLSRPAEPIPWRVHDLVADGSLTIISGESGSGKSWLAQALCSGVEHGSRAGGFLCVKGRALYVDGEMGATMFVDQRIRPTGVTASDFALIDAMGLDFSTAADFTWLRQQIDETRAKLVVIDSLRRLVPSKSENDSDDMAPVVASLAKLARDTRAALVLIHHRGDGEKFWRGSSAIRDQADALFALLREGNDGEVRRLSCNKGKGKMRYAPEPPDRFLTIDPEAAGIAACDPPEVSGASLPVLERVKTEILEALPAPTKAEAARRIGRETDNSSFRRAWKDLVDEGVIVQREGGVVVATPSPETTTPLPEPLRLA